MNGNRKAPVFIIGAPRSGTTMLRLMINAHPNIAVPFESDFIPKFDKRLDDYGDLSVRPNMARLLGDISANRFVKIGGLVRDRDKIMSREPKTYAQLIDAIYSTFAEAQGKNRWGDKDPDYVREVGLLWRLFSGCNIIHIVRDGRAVANSLRKLEWGSKNMIKLAQDWRWDVTLAHKMGQMIKANYLEIRYEELVQQPEPSLRRICRFIDEPFDKAMLDYHKTATQFMPSTALKYHATSVRAPDVKKTSAWSTDMSRTQQAAFEQVAGDSLEAFGYPLHISTGGFRTKLYNMRYTLWRRW